MNSISKKIKKWNKQDNNKDLMRKALNKLDAWSKGKRVILHDDNGKRVEAKQLWGLSLIHI